MSKFEWVELETLSAESLICRVESRLLVGQRTTLGPIARNRLGCGSGGRCPNARTTALNSRCVIYIRSCGAASGGQGTL